MFGLFKKPKELVREDAAEVIPLSVAEDPKIMGSTVEEKKGLEVKFGIGENLPWKGISFKIESVEYDRIVLRAVSVTSRMSKRIEEAKSA